MKRKVPLYFGRNIIEEAFLANAEIKRIFVENAAAFKYLESLPAYQKQKIPTEKGIPAEIKKESHQGVAFECSFPFYTRYEFDRLKKHRFVVLCNHIEDVHNLGSIARCAAGFGASLIVHEEAQSASVTPAVVKSSAGCAFRVKFMKTPDLLRVVQSLEKLDFEFAALDLSEQSISLYDWKPKLPLALILGSEGSGIDDVLRKKCQSLVKIPLQNKVDSLNVSHAAGIAMSWASKNFSLK
jgi:23S rRNA (guanosine2251-2'-O)-methyltransferase